MAQEADGTETNVHVESTIGECDKAVYTIGKGSGLSLSDIWEVVSYNLLHNFKGQENYVFMVIICCCCEDLFM